MTVVMLGGGIDLSVGSIFALATFAAVSAFFIFDWPVWAALAAALATGGLYGAINGYLVGYLRLRAFLTTLVTFIIGRALFDILVVNFAARIQLSARTSDLWDFIGDGTIYGLSVSVLVAAASWRSSPTSRSPARGPAGMCSRSGDRAARPTIPASGSERPSS